MSNHLMELKETKSLWLLDRHDRYIATENAKTALNDIENCMCFDLGSFDSYQGIKAYPMEFRLPYDNCWFEFKYESEEVICGIRAFAISESRTMLSMFVRDDRNKEWSYSYSVVCGLVSEELKMKFFDVEPPQEMPDEICLICIFIQALRCKNVVKIEHKPDAKLQKSRVKRGKKPLFSYWTLELTDQKTESGATRGGTHASPRLHLRRGHPRQFKPGYWTWVQPCAVGSKKLGMVHKDYLFTPSNNTVH